MGLPDPAVAGLALCASLALVKGLDRLVAHGAVGRKLGRKLVHILVGPGFLLSWLCFSSAPGARVWAAAVPAANVLRLAAIGSGAWADEATVKVLARGDAAGQHPARGELLQGPLYYATVMVACTLGFWRADPAGVVALMMMCGGDGLADIVGRRFGAATGPLPWNRDKSWAGSAGCFLGGTAFSGAFLALFTACGCMNPCGGDALAVVRAVGAIGLVATAAESLSRQGGLDDNLTVPGSAILTALALRPF